MLIAIRNFLIGFMVFGINFLCYAYIGILITETNKIMVVFETLGILFLVPIVVIVNIVTGYCATKTLNSP